MRPSNFAVNLLRRLILLAGLCGLLLPPAHAESATDFSVRGFGTLGMARTNSDDVEFVRDLSQPQGIKKSWSGQIDSALGVQANWRWSPQLEVVAQGLSRYRFDHSFRPDLAWAYIKYDPTPALSLRAGRLGTEFFMQADSRWVGYSFLTVRPVGDYFWYLPFYSIHGGDAALTIPLGESILRSKLFFGHASGSIPLAGEQWDIAGSPMGGGYVELLHGPWHLRGSYANIRFAHDLPLSPVVAPVIGRGLTAAEADYLATENRRTHYYSLGLIYDRGPWQAQLMLNHIEQGSHALENSAGGYALLGYRIGQLTPYVGYSWIKSQRNGAPLNAIAAYVISDSHSDQKTSILGLRWDLARDIALKTQWDAIRGSSSSVFPYRMENRQTWQGNLDVFSLTLDFVF